jgi:MFS_1 like family
VGNPAAFGVALSMFFTFFGVAANQFHGYLFEIRGHGALTIGLLFMTGNAAGVLAPLAQVFAIRFFHGPYIPLVSVAIGAALSMLLLPHTSGFASLFTLFALLTFCVSSIFPLLTAAVLETTRERGHGVFVRIRGLGTAGFLAACLGCLAFDESRDLPILYAGFGLGFFLALICILPAAKAHGQMHKSRNGSFERAPKFGKAWKRLFRGEAVVLMALLAAMGFANTMATVMQGNYLMHRFALDQRSISLAWAVSTACEIGWMLLCARVIRTMDLRRVMVLGLWGTLAKLALLAWADHYVTFVAGLVFHGLFFSFALTGFGVYLDRRFRTAERPVLQALTASLVQGVPAAAAGITGGLIWKHVDLHTVYISAAVLAGVVCFWGEIWARRRSPVRIGNFNKA